MRLKKKILSRWVALAPLIALLPLTASAAMTMKDVEKRLQAYESRIQQLEQQLAETKTKVVAAETKQVNTENAKVAALDSQVKSLQSEISVDKEKFKINGFMSAGVAYQDQGNYSYDNIDGKEYDTQATNQVGVQMAYKVNDKINAQVQILAQGWQDYDADVAWAFLSYDVTPDFTVRAGQLRTPFFMLSEYLDVGYAYPWVRPPQEMYALTGGLDAYDGFDAAYTIATGDLINRVMVYGGRINTTDNSDNNTTVDKLVGTRVTSTIGNWTFGAGYARGDLTAESDGINGLNGQLEAGADFAPLPIPGIAGYSPLLENDNPANFGGIGVTYDNGDWLLMAEHGRVRIDNLYPDTEGQYITVAKRFDKFQPYISYAHSYTINDGDRTDAANAYYGAADTIDSTIPFIPDPDIVAQLTAASEGFVGVANGLTVLNTAQRSMTYGVRYDFMEGIDIKFEYEHIYDLENGGLYSGFNNPDDPIGNGDITTISIDAVF
jgi:hypothetical protein